MTRVELDSLVQTVSASGKIQPKVDVDISANVSGRILDLGAKEGDNVRQGQLLVRIEAENYEAALKCTGIRLSAPKPAWKKHVRI